MIVSEFKNTLLEFLSLNTQVKRLCVAYSGGLDSSVLLSLVDGFCKEHNKLNSKALSICALHLNHGLSPNASSWEDFCKQTCESYKCEFIHELVNIDRVSNVEKQAREKRYQFFQDQCGENDVLLMAHHLNDQTETLLFRFFRGSSARALMGIPQQRELDHIHNLDEKKPSKILRPLLGVSKDQLLSYAEKEGLSWIEDESNQDKKYARNFIRHELLPRIREYWPQVDNNLAKSARYFSETERLLSDLAQLDLSVLLNKHPSLRRWGEHLDLKVFKKLSIERKKNVLRFWMADKAIDLPPENRLLALVGFVEDFEREGSGQFSWKQDDFEITFRVFEDHLFFHQYPLEKGTFKNFQWNLNTNPYFDCGIFRYQASLSSQSNLLLDTPVLDVRLREGGERCQPLGRAHSQSLKKLFQEYHIPPWERDDAPLFYVGNTIAAVSDFWVCEGFQPTQDVGEKEGQCWSIQRMAR